MKMVRRLVSTALAVCALVALCSGTASAGPITIGSFTWDDSLGIGPSFKVANFSDTPLGTPPPAVGAGSFSGLTLVLVADGNCDAVWAGVGVERNGCTFTLDSLAVTGQSSPFEFAAVVNGSALAPANVRVATLSLSFGSYALETPLTIADSDVVGGVDEEFITVVPEPGSLVLLATGLALTVRRRLRG